MEKRMVIAIDGPAGAGKSTVARMVAERLGYVYIDTGAMYRAITLKALRQGVDPRDRLGMAALAADTDIRLVRSAGGGVAVLLDGEDVTSALRQPPVETAVSVAAQVQEVREAMVALQRRLAAGGGVVLDGRDTGTLVVPEADRKFFLTASPSTRVARRYRQLRDLGHAVSHEEVARDLHERDRLDREREHAPLKPADDAVVIDTTDLGTEQVVELILALCGCAARLGAGR